MLNISKILMLNIRDNKLKIIIYSLTALIALVFAFLPLVIKASDDSVEIINNISVSASTGGNEAEAGEVVEGEAKSSVEVKTIIDGEVVEDINITEESDTGDASIKVESRIERVMDARPIFKQLGISGEKFKLQLDDF